MNTLDYNNSIWIRDDQKIIYWLFINFWKEYLGIIWLLSEESRTKLLSFVNISEDWEYKLMWMNECDIYIQICTLINREKARFVLENIFRNNYIWDLSTEFASNYMKSAQEDTIKSLWNHVTINDDNWEINIKNIDLSQYFYLGLDMTPLDTNLL